VCGPSNAMKRKALLRYQSLRAALILALILNVIFFPVIWGNRTLLSSAWDAPSVMLAGAYHQGTAPSHSALTPDPGAPAWQSEPWIKIISEQYLKERRLPLWNPYNAYGTPFAAAMQPQPFFPLTALLSLDPTPRTYNVFIIARLFLAGILTFFFARLFLDYISALFAAIAFMLSGYFIIFLDMPHLSVEILLPALFLASELLLRKGSWAAVAGTAATIFLCIVGGMPESSFLIISFSCLYVLFRLLQSPDFRSRIVSLAGAYGIAVLLGFALSAFLLLPFAEFMHQAHDTHQPANLGGEISGLVSDGDWRLAVTYLLPFLFSPALTTIFRNPWGGMQSYWGVLPFLFSVCAVLSVLSKHAAKKDPRRALTIFFFVLLIVMLLKRFGNPLINWVGGLPVANLVFFLKYQEPLMAFCVAILASIGFSFVMKQRDGFRLIQAAVVIVVCAVIVMAAWYWPPSNSETSLSFYWALIVTLVVVCIPLVLCGLASSNFPRPTWLSWSLIGLLSAELFCNFIVPNWYLFNTLPPAAAYNPYDGAPYIRFLRSTNTDRYRVFGRDGILFPNWSGVFGLSDARDLDGMYFRRYIKFVRSLLLRPDDEARLHDELADRFTGIGNGYTYKFSSELEQRFLTLSSIKYILSSPNTPFQTNDQLQNSLRNVYENEVVIYEFSRPLPRASLFYAVESLPDDTVLKRLKDPEFDPLERVVLSTESLSPESLTSVDRLAAKSARPTTAANIIAYESQRVRIETEADEPAILMLNDTYYPGWRALVNGKPTPILQADYLFRGVIVPAGHTVVDFEYVPTSFRLGATISLAALALLAVPLVVRRVRRAQATGPTSTRLRRTAEELIDSVRRSSRMSFFDQQDIVIRRKSGRVVACIPRFSLYAHGNTIDAALAALDAKKISFTKDLEDAGELEDFESNPPPLTNGHGPPLAGNARGDLRQFAVKVVIVAAAIAAVLMISGLFIASTAQSVVSSIKGMGGHAFWGRVERELDRMASSENDMPEAKKQKVLADIRAIGAKWRPFVIELHSALTPPERATEHHQDQFDRK
jgi:Bacterial membrane protein YfhO